jgi:hypothetical protein
MTAFWDIASCSLVEIDDVSEVRTVSIIRAINKPIYPADFSCAAYLSP